MKNFLKKMNRALYTQILFAALAFIVMVSMSYFFMSSIVRVNLVRNVNTLFGFVENRIDRDLSNTRYVLDGVAGKARDILLSGGAEALKNYIDSISRSALFFNYSAIDIKGFYGYFETLPGGPALMYDPSCEPLNAGNPEESAWYRLAVTNTGAAETIPYINESGETLFTYAKSIYDGEGRRLGVVAADIRIDKLGYGIVETALNQGGYGMLLNQNLLMMAHPNLDFVGHTADEPDIPINIFAEELRSAVNVTERRITSYDGQKSVAFFRRLSNGWYLGLVSPQNQFYQSINRMAASLYLLGAALAAILIWILIRIDAARAKADDENRKKSVFLANMSHEIRTPINAIVGMSTIGRTAPGIERKDYCFLKIDEASRHLLGVINDILDMSKIAAQKIELNPTNFIFEKMLQQSVNVVSFQVNTKRQDLKLNLDQSIPKVLFADDQRIAQVITNLLSNAVKFTPGGGSISLKAALQGEADGVCSVKVEVTDTGIGISPEQQTKLFQSFQQLEASTTRKYGGTGLGLSISKSIVEMMGGKIWVESELGKGTTFAFTIKARRGDGADLELGRRVMKLNNISILAVDDDPDVLTYFQEVIAGMGSGCDAAPSAAEAMRLIERHGSYDIYFVDLKMPDVDGIALTKEIRAREKEHGTSFVVMVSSYQMDEIEEEARKAGVNKFLPKPLFPSAIVDVISECVGTAGELTEDLTVNIGGIFEGKRVLLAEDIDINREIIKTLLEPTLVEIDCAENGFQAVKMFSEAPEKYDMIFMDIQMPEMDGYDASRRIRASGLPKSKTIPIVALTANVFKEDIENCLAAGMNNHLSKPLSMNDLLAISIRYLKKTAEPRQ